MNYSILSDKLTNKLNLINRPIAWTKVNEQPNSIKEFEGEVPSTCAFWRKAENEVFFASAEKHYNCPIGAMTMGFPLPADVANNLQMFVEKMLECNYLDASEIEKLPKLSKDGIGIVYGPLQQFPLKPDCVIMWLNPAQLMMFNEAIEKSNWNNVKNFSVYGRPGCATLPISVNNEVPGTSLGCAGMRTFTEIDDQFSLTTIPGNFLDQIDILLDNKISSNNEMRDFYEAHKSNFIS